MTFAEKLRELRVAKGWSQKELADQSRTKQQSITDWENGKTVPAFDAVQAICEALGVECTVFNGCKHATLPAKKKQDRGRPKNTGNE